MCIFFSNSLGTKQRIDKGCDVVNDPCKCTSHKNTTDYFYQSMSKSLLEVVKFIVNEWKWFELFLDFIDILCVFSCLICYIHGIIPEKKRETEWYGKMGTFDTIGESHQCCDTTGNSAVDWWKSSCSPKVFNLYPFSSFSEKIHNYLYGLNDSCHYQRNDK